MFSIWARISDDIFTAHGFADTVEKVRTMQRTPEKEKAIELIPNEMVDAFCAVGPIIGRVYVPALLAKAEALRRGADPVATTIDGKAWVQKPFSYQAKCLQWVREQYGSLTNAEREAVNDVFAGRGCEALFNK